MGGMNSKEQQALGLYAELLKSLTELVGVLVEIDETSSQAAANAVSISDNNGGRIILSFDRATNKANDPRTVALKTLTSSVLKIEFKPKA